ncbi:hypothetical protein TPHA_0N01690 [Tetrapisispora phaffii CBS 4417]|uniref:Guanine nucleotide-binding protein alpha-1 subunit n=1 Tax=Tetrapisispora phaffii (strain ATCC 24235 / CBS 4417 / NBRC 1672 / NRRL Y-8282 / UCD 70-5) TaxID=1071381 RepID=G8C1C2_TETPH|nr:hypothetical protein TPHA_0N01690 [Tetrapisispora phaffii CBS 4417]CCE65950.1 hypothetical protein TPHA_0N01690 [Tetrapisispora phaffii CBS 4417]
MGCTASTSAYDDYEDEFLQSRRNNDAIEKQLLMDKQKEKNQVRLLLLGAGESGKSTVLKQLNLLHHGGFSHQERLQYAQVIWADALQSMKILIIQARRLGISLDCDDPEKNRELFECKRVILNTNTLETIDASVAGGSRFLNDYVLKYSERQEKKRRIESTGEAQALDIDVETELLEKHSSDFDYEEISKDLSDSGDDQMFIAIKCDASTKSKSPTSCSKNDVIAMAIEKLWKEDSGIQQCFGRANEFQLEGSSSYYFDNIKKFAQEKYVCTNEDILKGRIKTTGITETDFNIGSSKFKVFDAGGQRSERKKWIHCFQGISAVCFIVALSEYDQMLFEDEKVNRMHESIMLFNTLVNSQWFRDTPFILFLNKTDLFEEKVKRVPIRKYFPSYQGKLGDSKEGIKYFENIFLGLNKTNKPIYVKRTCATDTETMKFVLSAVTDLIIQQNFKKSGII